MDLLVFMVWYGMVWCMVWYGMVWYRMGWRGMGWLGLVWSGIDMPIHCTQPFQEYPRREDEKEQKTMNRVVMEKIVSEAQAEDYH